MSPPHVVKFYARHMVRKWRLLGLFGVGDTIGDFNMLLRFETQETPEGVEEHECLDKKGVNADKS